MKKQTKKKKQKTTKKKQEKQSKRKKLKILAAGDLHGDTELAKKLAEKAKKANVDLVVLTGDITGLIETEDLIKPFKQKNKQVLFVPGNWDSQEAADFLAKHYQIKNLDNYYVKYHDVGIFGLGNPNFQLEVNEASAFNKLKRNFEKIKDLEKKIMVTHLHAAGTKSELSGFPGSKGIRKALEILQPDLFISGHIHELEGVEDKIGKTRVLNVGRKGKIIEI